MKHMIDADFILAPVRLLESQALLGGGMPDHLPADCEVVRDLELAMNLENEQDLPPGYLVWKDVQERAVAQFRSSPAFHEAEKLIDPVIDAWWNQQKARRLQVRKDQIRGTVNLFDEFFYTVDYDISQQLKMVSAARYCLAEVPPVLEVIFDVYRAGFYPCGWTQDNRIVAFDATVLKAN
ncbi:MAG: hypothetical protein Q4G25_07045 [Paracoccus sp. (in: a-proteobacteria)]|nr:hypothetical protein [Paracoccus sp. (in: a-proteobacteria)]